LAKVRTSTLAVGQSPHEHFSGWPKCARAAQRSSGWPKSALQADRQRSCTADGGDGGGKSVAERHFEVAERHFEVAERHFEIAERHFEVAERRTASAASASALCSTFAHTQKVLGAGRRRRWAENDAVQVAV